MKSFRLLAMLAPLLLCHCAYQWGHGDRSLPGNHKTAFVEVFTNKSSELGAEIFFTESLNQQLQRSGFVKVTDRNRAEVIIRGEIISVNNFDYNPLSAGFYDTDQNTGQATRYNRTYFTRYGLLVTVSISAIRSRDKQLIWQTVLTGQREYQGAQLTKPGIRSSNMLYNQSRRKQTMKLIAQDLMTQGFDRLTENF